MDDDLPTRQSMLNDLNSQQFDLLIIGGGIVGAGVARDAAMRGLHTGLIEQDDFAFGTSSRSSRLLHGGLRYLAQGRVGLVREASIEKRIIHEIAPHLAQPLPFIFPTFADDPEWVLWKLKIGVKLYDALCGWKNLGRSQWLSADDVHTRSPLLRTDRLTGGVRYFDGLTNDARLVMDTLRSAAAHGATLCNRVRYHSSERDGNAWICRVEDILGGSSFNVRTRWVVNAAGPWASQVPRSKLRLRMTKGVHLVVDAARLPVRDAVVMTEGRRILFVIPWGDRVILGTTDTDHEGPIESVATTPRDVDYILNAVNAFFPSLELTQQDVRATWAGLRPLVADKKGHPSDATRSHQILHSTDGWLDVAGGKLTTYRLIAEQVVDAVLRVSGMPKRACLTAHEPLISTAQAAGISGILPPEVSQSAVQHYCRSEWALTLQDIMIRRSSWHYYVPDARETARRVAEWMAVELGWDSTRIESELRDYITATTWSNGTTKPEESV